MPCSLDTCFERRKRSSAISMVVFIWVSISRGACPVNPRLRGNGRTCGAAGISRAHVRPVCRTASAPGSQPDRGERNVDGVEVEGLGVERAAAPLQKMRVVRVSRIADRLQELGVTPDAAVATGGAAVVERLRRKVPPSARSDTNARAWRRLLPFGEVVKTVEAVKGEQWESFAGRKGDCGRDPALHVARMNCGLSIPELAALAGLGPAAASKAIQRMRKRLPGDRKLRSMSRKVSVEISVRAS